MAALFKVVLGEVVKAWRRGARHTRPIAGQGLQDTSLNLGGVVRIHQDAKLAVSERLAAAVFLAANHRQAAGHRLEIHYAEAFAMTGHHVRIRQPVVIRLLFLRNPAGEDN